jgi:hypothetical protein
MGYCDYHPPIQFSFRQLSTPEKLNEARQVPGFI